MTSAAVNVVIDERYAAPQVEPIEDIQWAALHHVRTRNNSRVLKDYVFSTESVVL